MCEKEKISLIVTEEQKETLLSMFGYYGWDVDGVKISIFFFPQTDFLCAFAVTQFPTTIVYYFHQ
jgi:hypothetical protein